jgi:hypothetical protein
MKRLWVLVMAVAAACDGSSSGTDPDAGTSGQDDGGGSDGDGGVAGPRTVSLLLTNRPNNAAQFSFLVAYQDGSAPWQLAPAPTGDTYSFTINAPSYSVAFACIGTTPGATGATQRSVTIAQFAVGERTSLTLDVPPRCSDRMQGGFTLSGTVTNRPTGGVLVAQFGTRSAFVSSQSGNFVLTNVPAGTRDLVIAHAVSAGSGDYYVDEVVVQRDVAVTANTQRSINFANSEATSFYTVDPGNASDAARVVASTTLYTNNGTQLSLTRLTQEWETDVLADAQMKPTDVYDQSIAVTVLGSGATITHATDQPGEQTYEAPAPLGTVVTTVPTKQPYITLESQWAAYANVIGYTWNANQQGTCGNTACTTVWSAYLSPGVTGAMPAFRMPDLSALTGWKDAFHFASGSIVGSVTAITSTAGAGDFPTGIPAKGTDRAFVRSDYAVSP